jgi:hypothetical protein
MTFFRAQTISVKNIDSVDAPAFALMFVVDSETRDDELVLHVRRPSASDVTDSTSANYVFGIGLTVKAGQYGGSKTSSFGFVLCKNIGAAFSELGPVADSWYLDGNATKKMFSFVVEDATEAADGADGKTAIVRAKSAGGSRRANAVLDADMLPTDDFVSVVSIEPIEGEGDTEPIDAANVLKWYGITGNKCKIEYNPNFDNGVDPETSEPLPSGGWELYAIEVNYTLECPVIEEEPA